MSIDGKVPSRTVEFNSSNLWLVVGVVPSACEHSEPCIPLSCLGRPYGILDGIIPTAVGPYGNNPTLGIVQEGRLVKHCDDEGVRCVGAFEVDSEASILILFVTWIGSPTKSCRDELLRDKSIEFLDSDDFNPDCLTDDSST